MSKDFLKEKISWYKLLFTILVTVLIGNISWFMGNYQSFAKIIIIADGIVVYKIRFYLKKMEEI